MNLETITIKVFAPDGSVEELALESQDSLILGSGASATVRLDDDKISSIHAMIKLEDGVVRVVDLGSEQGTRLGGKEIREQDLSSGDVVEIGDHKVQVLWGTADQPDALPTEVLERPPGIGGDDEAALGEQSDGDSAAERKGADGVADLFSEVIPEDERPTPENRLLEVVMVWSDTIIGIGHFGPKDGTITVGDAPRNYFNLASEILPSSRFPFIKTDGKDHIVTITQDMDLRVRDDDGRVFDLASLQSAGRAFGSETSFKGYSYKINLHEQVQVNIGDTALVARYVRPSARVGGSILANVDYYFTKVFSTSFMAHLLFIAALMLTPTDLERLSDDLFTSPNRFAKLIIQPPDDEERVFDDLSALDDLLAKEDEGKFGEIEEVEEEAAPSDEGAPIVDVDQREEDRKKVMETGLLAALEDGAASNVFGPGGLGTGINEALGGIDGDGMGDAFGLGGLGSRGAGAGGAGSALGIGGLGTKGGGKGGGHGQVDLGGRGRAVTKVTSGQTIIEGGLDREVIARIVRRHQNEIRFCYERELQRDPNLHGRVAVQWVIDGTGAVVRATIQDTTMGNSNVENCILTRVRRWRFPEPRGGGIVRVTYPWIFSPRS